MREKLNLSVDSLQAVKIDSSKVPADLRNLTPFAEKWGVSDDILRGDLQAKASSEDKAALSAVLKGRNGHITQWLNSYSKGFTMTDEAAAFTYMQRGLDEMGL